MDTMQIETETETETETEKRVVVMDRGVVAELRGFEEGIREFGHMEFGFKYHDLFRELGILVLRGISRNHRVCSM